jgi:hypothetical protein
VPASDVPLSRRAAVGVVAGAAAVSLAGCTDSGTHRSSGHVEQSPDAEPDPDVVLAGRALARERVMLQQVTATLHAHPGLAGALADTRATHRAHVQLLTRAVPGSSPSPSPPPSPSPSPTEGPAPAHAVPHRPGAALAALAGEEARLARFARHSALAARSGAFARVLASAAAAAAQQVTGLTAAAGAHR